MDLSGVDPATFAQMCAGYFQPGFFEGTGNNNASVLLQYANQPPDRDLVQQAVAYLDRWYPGWSADELSRDVRIVVTDQIPSTEGGSCRQDGSDHPGFILIGAGGWHEPVGMASGLAHEARHIENSKLLPGLTINQDESDAWKVAATVYMKAAGETTDPALRQSYLTTGNRNYFLGEQIGRCQLDYFQPQTYLWTLNAWVDLQAYVAQNYGLSDGQYRLVNSDREAPDSTPSASAQYTFYLDAGAGQPITIKLTVDETADLVREK